MRNPRNETLGVTLPSRLREDAENQARSATSRSPHGEGLSGPVPDANSPSPNPSRKREGNEPHTPERTCILTRRKGTKDALIRLALGPDGEVAPDVRARAPGRGAWIGVSRDELDAANAKGRLKAALQRAFKSNDVTVPADLGERTEAALRRHALDRLGMEARASNLVTGYDRIETAARSGKVHLLLHASDAGEDGCKSLDQALRVGARVGGGERQGMIFPEPRTILSMALGRENVVHVALTDPAAASRARHALARWLAFTGPKRGPEGGEPAFRTELG